MRNLCIWFWRRSTDLSLCSRRRVAFCTHLAILHRCWDIYRYASFVEVEWILFIHCSNCRPTLSTWASTILWWTMTIRICTICFWILPLLLIRCRILYSPVRCVEYEAEWNYSINILCIMFFWQKTKLIFDVILNAVVWIIAMIFYTSTFNSPATFVSTLLVAFVPTPSKLNNCRRGISDIVFFLLQALK